MADGSRLKVKRLYPIFKIKIFEMQPSRSLVRDGFSSSFLWKCQLCDTTPVHDYSWSFITYKAWLHMVHDHHAEPGRLEFKLKKRKK